MRLVIFVSLIAAVAADTGAFPALPGNFAEVADNGTSTHSTVQLYHTIANETCQLWLTYDGNLIKLSSLITAFVPTDPAGSLTYNIPLNNLTTTAIAVNCTMDNKPGTPVLQMISNKDSQSWVVLASSSVAIQFINFGISSATGFFPTYYNQTEVSAVDLVVNKTKSVPLSPTQAPRTDIESFEQVVFTTPKGWVAMNLTTPFVNQEQVVFWITANETIFVIRLWPQGTSFGRLNVVNGVTDPQELTVMLWETPLAGGAPTPVQRTLAYGATAAFSFAQGNLLSHFEFSFAGQAKNFSVTNFNAGLWGTYLLAGFNGTVVFTGRSNVTAMATVFLDNEDEVRAAITSGVKKIVRFANAMVGDNQDLEYIITATKPAVQQHAVRRILRPQAAASGNATFTLKQGQAQSYNVEKDSMTVSAQWTAIQKPEVNGTYDVLAAANAQADATAFNVFTIGDPESEKPEYKPKDVTTYDAPAPSPAPQAPTEESSFWSQPWPYIVIAAFVLVVFGGGFYFYKKHQESSGSEGKPLLG